MHFSAMHNRFKNNIWLITMLHSMSVPSKPVGACSLSVVAWIFILLGSVVMSRFALGVPGIMMGGTEGMQVGTGMTGSMMGGMMVPWMLGSVPVLAAFGIASGIMVILGSVMLYTRSAENHLWGAIILAFSLVSILGSMGGLLVGLVLGMLGGILALTWTDTGKPIQQTGITLPTSA